MGNFNDFDLDLQTEDVKGGLEQKGFSLELITATIIGTIIGNSANNCSKVCSQGGCTATCHGQCRP